MKRVRLLLFAIALASAACSNNDSSTTTPTTPALTTTNEYTGTLTPNGAATYPFAVLTSGDITATILSLSNSVATVGFGVGVWDGFACDASPGIWQDKATQGTTVSAKVTQAGSLCVRIYDSQGTLTDPTDYDIQVSHP